MVRGPGKSPQYMDHLLYGPNVVRKCGPNRDWDSYGARVVRVGAKMRQIQDGSPLWCESGANWCENVSDVGMGIPMVAPLVREWCDIGAKWGEKAPDIGMGIPMVIRIVRKW